MVTNIMYDSGENERTQWEDSMECQGIIIPLQRLDVVLATWGGSDGPISAVVEPWGGASALVADVLALSRAASCASNAARASSADMEQNLLEV